MPDSLKVFDVIKEEDGYPGYSHEFLPVVQIFAAGMIRLSFQIY